MQGEQDVTTEIVPYQQLERMAVTLVKSKMFGLENEAQALALMLLAQSENIHPMTAVRDFHIIKGRPSMKADTMLARFQADGGIVEWVELTDVKCVGVFSHPTKSPRPVKIEWTIERATKAGLTSNPVWNGYARAMLRSRTVSEGVRTVNPGVTKGIYTPEEIAGIGPDSPEPITVAAAVDSFERPGLPNAQVDGFIRAISEAATLQDLKRLYQDAFNAAKSAQDALRIGSFTLAYEARKAELDQPAAPAAAEPIEGDIV